MHPTVIVTNVTFSSRRKAIIAKRFAVKGIRNLSFKPTAAIHIFQNKILIVAT